MESNLNVQGNCYVMCEPVECTLIFLVSFAFTYNTLLTIYICLMCHGSYKLKHNASSGLYSCIEMNINNTVKLV